MATAAAMMPERRPLEKTLSGYDITIGLEDERGQLAPVDIDEADDVIKDDYVDKPATPEAQPQLVVQAQLYHHQSSISARRVSITEQVLKARNSEHELQGLQEQAMSRKQQFAALLQEHAQIVNSVHRLEEADGGNGITEKGHGHTGDKENF